jgi:hypothetical protein
MFFKKNVLNKEIVFTNTLDIDIIAPEPASKLLPDWYKNHKSYFDDVKAPSKYTNDKTSATIKKCMPVFDSLSAGYILRTPAEIHVARPDNVALYTWPSILDFNLIDVQTANQFVGHPESTGDSIPKLLNYWSIKTPKGYSCLFVPPMHHETPIKILPGIVDTDKYSVPINFPFTFSDPNFTGFIPLGTPYVQIIPFKRDTWKHTFSKNTEKIKKERDIIKFYFFEGYKKNFWTRKEYK